MIAAAGKVTIAEVENLYEIGELDPNSIHTPSFNRSLKENRKNELRD
jgi:3-oxoacid CoA-transferase subunit A